MHAAVLPCSAAARIVPIKSHVSVDPGRKCRHRRPPRRRGQALHAGEPHAGRKVLPRHHGIIRGTLSSLLVLALLPLVGDLDPAGRRYETRSFLLCPAWGPTTSSRELRSYLDSARVHRICTPSRLCACTCTPYRANRRNGELYPAFCSSGRWGTAVPATYVWADLLRCAPRTPSIWYVTNKPPISHLPVYF